MATIPTSSRHTSPPRTPKPATARPDAVCVRAGDLVLPTYLPASPDRNPMFLEKRVYQGSSGKVYPLPFTDRIAERPVDRKWKAIWIENRFLRVLVLPELGGRIHAIQDKTNGYDLIYNQPVIKPALVGLAGPWISGGIEFNWPQHHRPATFLPVDFEIVEHADGSKTVWCSDHDPMCRMKGMHGVCLHPGRAYVELKVRAYNRTPFIQTFLWWANVATRVHEAYQSFFPPDVYYVADHAKRAMSEYPLAKGFYYGVNYGERARRGVPANEIPGQFVPPHAAAKSEIRNSKSEISQSGTKPEARNLDGNRGRISDFGLPSNIGTRTSDFPDYAPNDLSFYANIPTPCSYMCMDSREDFFGGYDYKAEAGIVHIADHHIAPGKKQWTWGNHEFGYAWDRNLTEPDAHGEYGPYIELMAGVYTDNQPDFSFLQPGETKTWSQFWYPIQKIGPARHANLNAAISLRMVPGNNRNGHRAAQLGVAVTSPQPECSITLTARGKPLASLTRDLSPATPFVGQIDLPHGVRQTDLRVCVAAKTSEEIIAWRPKPRAKATVPPPATEPPAPCDIANADELFITGLHLAQYRHATRCPTLYWREALRRDPLDSRCNNAMGLWHLRRGEFAEAERHFRNAIERLTRRNANPADGEAHYNLGLCLRYQLDSIPQSAIRNPQFEEAYAAFYKATWNQAWAGAGFHALAEMDCARQDWPRALDQLNRSLRFDSDNLRARDLKVLVLRKLGETAEAAALLKDTLRLDPLDWWARHLDQQKLECDLQAQLDIAHDYARAGFYEEAIELLNASGARASARINEQAANGDQGGANAALPDQSWGALPLVHYTLGWLEEKRIGARASARFNVPAAIESRSGMNAALHHYRAAAALPTNYCFPARLEEIAVLEAAMRANPRDARAPHYLGNLLYDRRRHEEAIRLWERSSKLDPNSSVVWRNLGIGYFSIRRQPAKARAAYNKALKANPSDARLLYERDQLWKRLGESPAKRLRELEKYPELIRQRDDLSVELCTLYNQTGRHEQALALVGSRKFQPWEGGEGGPLGQWVRSNLGLGRAFLFKAGFRSDGEGRFPKSEIRNPKSEIRGLLTSAVKHLEAALTAPRNLGEARHLLANQSDLHYRLGCALAKLGDKAKAREHWLAAATFKGDFQEMNVRAFSEMTYYSALAWEKLGRKAKARKFLRDLLAFAKKLEMAEAKIDYFATSLPTMLLFEDNLQFRQKTTALFLQAQAHLGLGDMARARSLLRTVLKRDSNHALAADLASELQSSNGGKA